MNDSVASNRRSKRVDDDESMNDQPVQKSARREDESVAALSKNDLDIELEKRLDGLAKQLEDARRSVEKANNEKLDLARQNDMLKLENVRVMRREELAVGRENLLARENTNLKKELDAFDGRRNEEIAKSMNFDLAAKNFTLQRELDVARERETESTAQRDEVARKNEALEIEMAELRRKNEIGKRAKDKLTQENSSLKKEMDEMKKTADEDKKRDRERIDELKRNATHAVYRRCNPINILQLCCPNTRNSITLESALRQLQAAKNRTVDWDDYHYVAGKAAADVTLKCEVCEKVFKKSEVVDHFLTQAHVDKVDAHDAGVSKEAVKYWLAETQKLIVWQNAYYGYDSDSD